MTHSDSTPRIVSASRLGAALDEVGGPAGVNYLPDIVAQAGRTRQRPAWTFLERWLPMDIAVPRDGVPRTVFLVAALAMLLALLVATVAIIGSLQAPKPLTGAANGQLAFASGGNINVVEPDGSARRILVSGAYELGGMAYSPDGRRLAYWSRAVAGGTWDLIVVDSGGGSPVTLASGVSEVTGWYPAWTPDGTKIAYSARTTPRAGGPTCQVFDGDFCTSRIFLAAVDGSGARQIGDPALDARSPDWSPNGSTIAFGGGNASPTIGVHLYVMDGDGSNVRQLSDVIGAGWTFVRVDWSHDGTKIAGQAMDTGSIAEWDIWIIPLDGSAPTDVGAHTGGDEKLPSWAPDRDALAWSWNNMVLLEQGADPLDLPGTGAPQWSPDGKLLATTTAGGIHVMDLHGASHWSVAGTFGDPTWQPVYH
jgi:TolB protein